MPTYRVTDPQSGKTIKLTGDSPPTEAELSEIFARVGGEPAKFTGENLKDAQGNAVVRDTLASTLPGVGGFIGGLAGRMGGTILGGSVAGGTAGAIVGAGIGGMAGKGYGELLSHATELPGAIRDVYGNLMAGGPARAATIEGARQGLDESVLSLAGEGLKQAALQAGGEGIAAGAAALAPPVMKAAVNASLRLRKEFPNLSQTLIDNALRVSEGGYAKAQVLLKVASDKVHTALGLADATGVTIPVALTPEVAESLKTALTAGGIKSGTIPKTTAGGVVTTASARLPAKLQVVMNSIDQALENGTPMHLTPSEADLLKTELQRESQRLYDNAIAQNGPKAISQTAIEVGDFAARLNDAIDAVTKGYRDTNAVRQSLIGAERAIERGVRPTVNPKALIGPAAGALVGEETGRSQGHPITGMLSGMATGTAVGAALSPAGLSSTALLLAHPVLQQILTQMPRTTATALTAFLESQSGKK